MSFNHDKPCPDRDEKTGRAYLTEDYICRLNVHNGGYSNPLYNRCLILHYLGIGKIENLNAFKNISVIYLENNCITKIEGLSHMKELKCLYLQNNLIEEISGLDENINLLTLNLSNNKIKTIAGLEKLKRLETLNLEKNQIETLDDLIGLSHVEALVTLDISENKIDNYSDKLIELFEGLKLLKVLYLKGNDVVRKIPSYRKTMLTKLRGLTYLDTKPIDEGERLGADAFFKGGLEEERKVREEWRKQNDLPAKIRQAEADWASKESFEERRQRALFSINTEYMNRKNQLVDRMKHIVQEMKQYPERKNELTAELLSIEYQLKENDAKKLKEESEITTSMARREDVDKHEVFKYEDWMYPIFYNNVIQNVFDFSAAHKIIQFKFQELNVPNHQLFSELDLRMKWTEFELKKFKKEEFNYTLYNIDPSKYETKIENYIKEGKIEDNDFKGAVAVGKNNTNFEDLD
jgi:dynein assembly factor 1